jgi:hypothetical protein
MSHLNFWGDYMRRKVPGQAKPGTYPAVKENHKPEEIPSAVADTPEPDTPPSPVQAKKSTPNRIHLSDAAAHLGQRMKPFIAPLTLLWLLVFCAGTGIAALLWLMMLPPPPNCKQIQSLGLDADRLYCVEQATRSGNVDTLVQGLDLVRNWSADHPLHTRASHLADEWSSAVLDNARMKAAATDLTAAVALAQKIPPGSSVYKEAQAAITSWRKDMNRGQTLADAVQAAIKERNWGAAIKRLRLLAQLDSSYWNPQIDRMRQQISAEQIAANQLARAQTLAKTAGGNMQTLGQAIALAEQINPDTYAYKQGKIESERWIGALFAVMAGQLPPKTSLEGATAALQQLPRGVPAPAAVDVLWLSRAQPLVNDPLPRGALYQQLWHLWLVLSQVRQIRSNSPLYAQARAVLPKLETQLQDVTQLNGASLFANLGQIPTFQLAIHVASGIAPNRPRRIYAQTLVTMWQKDIERVQDRPYLVQANQLAAAGSVPLLKQAIATANQISLRRALRTEAQTLIAHWTQQIQILEDLPFLQQAQTLAKQQRLNQAVQMAGRIRPGRALYKEAQAAIADWVYQIQIAVDGPLLDRANALADQGNLIAAINLASQIEPGRSLYGTAQKAIAQWTALQTRQNPPPSITNNPSTPPIPSADAPSHSPSPPLSPTPAPPPTPSPPPSPEGSPPPPAHEVPTLPGAAPEATPVPSETYVKPSGSER